MARQKNIYERHLISSVINEKDQNVLLRAVELQSCERSQEALLEFNKLLMSRSIRGVQIYEIRLLLMKGDFRKASERLLVMIDSETSLASSPLDALILLLKCYLDIFLHLKLQEAVDVAREVRKTWLEPLDLANVTDAYVCKILASRLELLNKAANYMPFIVIKILLEYYYQSIINIKSLFQERLAIVGESPHDLRDRRRRLYDYLKSQDRHFEALEVARMEMKFGVSGADQLEILKEYLEVIDAPLGVLGTDHSFPEMFFESRRPLSAAYIHLSIGKVYCKLNLVEDGLKSFNTALEIFRGFESDNGQALVNLQVALLNKTKMTSYMGICEDLTNIATELMKCEDWIGTNSAMTELSEMLQCGPPSLQPRFQDCQLQIKSIYEHTGNSFNFWHMQSQVWMFEFTKVTSFGKGIEMCTAFFKENTACSIRLYKESFATMLQYAYEGIGDEEAALEYAKICLELTKEVGDRGLIIVNEITIAGLQRKSSKNYASQTELSERIRHLEKLFEEGSGSNGRQIVPNHILVTIAVYLADLWVTRWDKSNIDEAGKADFLPNGIHWIHTGQNLLPDVEEDNKSSSRASLSFVHANILQRMGRVDETVKLCKSVLSRQNGTLGNRDKANIQHLLATTLSVQCIGDPTTENFENAKEMYEKTITIATELGDAFMVAGCLKALVQMSSTWRRSNINIAIDLSDILGWIKHWEEIWEEILGEASVLRGLKGLQVRQRIRKGNSTSLYMTAIDLCIAQNNISEAWRWTQRAKARALINSLGLRSLIPSSMSQGLSESSTGLLEREQMLLDEIETTPEGGRYHLRMEHLDLRRKMSTISDLRAIQAIRRGGYLDVDELDYMFGGEKNVVCVDWVELEGQKYHIITVRPGEAPRYFATNVSVQEVSDWLECYVTGQDSLRNLEDALPEELEALNGLVSPLNQAHVTTDRDLLVFVPTGLLCSIPLHALNFTQDGETIPVIERNAVVYSNALAIFRQILVRSTNKNSTGPEKQFQVAVFGDPTPDARAKSEMVREVGEYLKADMFIAERATGKALLGALETHDLIHYQGHAEFNSANTLEESVLKLYDQKVDLSILFEIPILQSPHISLAACQSGQQTLNTGDEPLGFLTALTVAGAGSVLGTLWELDDIHASSIFTEYFYKDLRAIIQAGKQNFVFDLAAALRRAVCAMRKRNETNNLYRWAPFILYGSPWLRFNSDVLKHV